MVKGYKPSSKVGDGYMDKLRGWAGRKGVKFDSEKSALWSSIPIWLRTSASTASGCPDKLCAICDQHH